MAGKQPKSDKLKPEVVAFKVEKKLASLLDKLPNKSAFIRKAILAQLGMACPLCNGTGVVPRGPHDNYAALLGELKSKQCDGCGDPISLPGEAAAPAPEDRTRLEQFIHGGPLYCDGCYDEAPTCDECGWHIAEEVAAEHHHPHAEES